MTAGDDESGGSRAGSPPVAYEFPPPSATVQVAFGADSRRGRSRMVNEDHYLVIRLGRHQSTLLTSLPEAVIGKGFDEYGYAMVVADGLGGTGAGQTASRLALATLLHLVRHFGKWNLRIDDQVAQEILSRAEMFYLQVDRTLVNDAVTASMPTLQTTLTAVFGAGRDLFFAHVGHSRAYLFRERQLMRLTRDHTIRGAQESTVPLAPLVDVNLVAQDLRHVLTNAIGMRGFTGPTIDLERFQLADKDIVLVCTNGLTDAVEEPAIGAALASRRSPPDTCRALVELAVASGADDDVTALVAEYRIPG